MRADQLLVERGLAASRSQAARLIAGGVRWRLARAAVQDDSPWRTVAKNGDDVPEAAQLELVDAAEARYVSRGGLKLEGALRASGIDASGKRCLDVGQSTGGFTDCLLQHGAAHVVGVDVGHGQLHARIRADARVTPIEKVNARALRVEDLTSAGDSGAGFDLVVGDLSFISLTLVLPAIAPLLAPRGALLMLVKPQFELQPAQVGKGGIVRDTTLYPQVERRLRDACKQSGLNVAGWHDSAIVGGDGNREFFIHAVPRGSN
ncbi:TlyA family RNA methyltransferase [Variovorax sp. J22R133]|uniref:TlyA family RNA methyltransferase n=1 Tax=Variovorax brevis TaxID=3053503 RepID=UPI002576DC07|nr:TlyA family RNA methyltransferase [Variovorax sp. J22R133]MDM0114886.1 TlyA family RNA methyltransferase [Variovorax sp. J22R133]